MSAEAHERTSEPARLHVVARAREILRHREVIANLTGKELKVKYKSTALGVVWSMLNPALYLVVFFVVFTVFLRSGVPNFAVYLVSGLLAYTMYSTGFQGATISVVDNSPLVTKVAFPREILPLATIGASLVNFFYQFIVLLGFLIGIGCFDYWFRWAAGAPTMRATAPMLYTGWPPDPAPWAVGGWLTPMSVIVIVRRISLQHLGDSY
jgi:ABC-type polysaccharide/polyol phosphate export permease